MYGRTHVQSFVSVIHLQYSLSSIDVILHLRDARHSDDSLVVILLMGEFVPRRSGANSPEIDKNNVMMLIQTNTVPLA